ncbi:MAG TPA: 6,7-dimethyl-8-ribityllumazine synthase, partial [Bradyrhizobium sp.]|nr:6,7-dimethyl-8-ribityllumazine synthase [Bradyrhizobium sp.]
MNQMSQEPVQESQSQDAEAQSAASPATPEPRPRPAHPRFAKPQRVAFVQSAWHREVVAECRMAFLDEAEARNIPRAAIDVFEVPGSFEIPLHVQILAKTRR